MSDDAAANEERRERHRRWLILVICCLSLFMTWLDNSIVNVALPAIQRSLHASVAGLQWVVDAYLVVLASLLLAGGAISDRLGRKRLFSIGLLLFLLASLACSLAPGLGWLIAFRALQAVGGSLLVPSTLAIITNTFTDRAERARAIGVWSATFGVAIAAGPLCGGALVDGLGWRAVFWANVPIGAAAYLCARRVVPESRADSPRRVDRIGQLLAFVGIASLTFAVIEGPSEGWTSSRSLAAFALGAAMVALFVVVELHRSEPLLELRFFSSASFSAAFAIATLSFFVVTGFLFLNTFLLQEVRGDSALAAGLLTLPATAVVAPAALVSGVLVARRGPRLPLVLSGALMLLGCIGLSTLGPDSAYALYAPCYLLLGAGIGLGSPAVTNTAVSGMPREQAGVAGGGISLARQLGNLLGVAVLGSVLASEFHVALPARLAALGAGPAIRRALDGLPLAGSTFSSARGGLVVTAARDAFHSASHDAWLVAAVMSLLATAAAAWCRPARALANGTDHAPPSGAAPSPAPEATAALVDTDER